MKQSGDLMTILEKGLQEFHAEENEKNAEIQKALEGIMATRNVRPTVNGIPSYFDFCFELKFKTNFIVALFMISNEYSNKRTVASA